MGIVQIPISGFRLVVRGDGLYTTRQLTSKLKVNHWHCNNYFYFNMSHSNYMVLWKQICTWEIKMLQYCVMGLIF